MHHPFHARSSDEKLQLTHRQPAAVREILSALHDRRMDAATASERMQIGKSLLYVLRAQWLGQRTDLVPQASGGSRHEAWPEDVCRTLQELLKVITLNFALLADELERRQGFGRSRAAVADFARRHFPQLLAEPLRRGPKPKRRWQCAAVGNLWQHDSSSPHGGRPGPIRFCCSPSTIIPAAC